MLDWFWSYLTYRSGTRLITGSAAAGDDASARGRVGARRPVFAPVAGTGTIDVNALHTLSPWTACRGGYCSPLS
jgi:hypothetical protein